ncbi:hypothetical protein AB0C84_23950 [Actinomadura sp. NPDC048955]|uniref:hypothetical protein n=1 Tax=Actinomadura sp. NPDC048955 TaxID=3158228 RepID=UPI0033DFF3D9
MTRNLSDNDRDGKGAREGRRVEHGTLIVRTRVRRQTGLTPSACRARFAASSPGL